MDYIACLAPLSVGFSRQKYWSGLLCPPPGDLPDRGVEPMSLMSPALAGRFFTISTTWEDLFAVYVFLNLRGRVELEHSMCLLLCKTQYNSVVPKKMCFSQDKCDRFWKTKLGIRMVTGHWFKKRNLCLIKTFLKCSNSNVWIILKLFSYSFKSPNTETQWFLSFWVFFFFNFYYEKLQTYPEIK